MARLSTVTPGGAPHVVAIVFAIAGDVAWTAIDAKPKSTRALRRLANIAANPRVSLLVDVYDDDWSRLWWVRLDGVATVLSADDAGAATGVAALVAKYPQYRADPPAGPLIWISVERRVSWSAR
ncbi:MAG: TIGR03668 family PPOX class F420-dependent oxidoreductase [Micrococcales bacterium]|nr:TIGR03668 family PPOX class F420-dependent oxidoreductase [Micrococcales bacterium]